MRKYFQTKLIIYIYNTIHILIMLWLKTMEKQQQNIVCIILDLCYIQQYVYVLLFFFYYLFKPVRHFEQNILKPKNPFISDVVMFMHHNKILIEIFCWWWSIHVRRCWRAFYSMSLHRLLHTISNKWINNDLYMPTVIVCTWYVYFAISLQFRLNNNHNKANTPTNRINCFNIAAIWCKWYSMELI